MTVPLTVPGLSSQPNVLKTLSILRQEMIEWEASPVVRLLSISIVLTFADAWSATKRCKRRACSVA